MSDEPARHLELVPRLDAPSEPSPIRGADVVKLLEMLLVDARAGKLIACGAYTVSTNGAVNLVEAGSAACGINSVAGAELLARAVVDRVTGRR